MLLFALTANAQNPTAGIVYLPAIGAGASVLDPNADGFTSGLSSGFVANDVSWYAGFPISCAGFPILRTEAADFKSA